LNFLPLHRVDTRISDFPQSQWANMQQRLLAKEDELSFFLFIFDQRKGEINLSLKQDPILRTTAPL